MRDAKGQHERRSRATLLARSKHRLTGDADWLISAFVALLGSAPNRRCLRVFAMRRSGHHAIMNWIRYQIDGKHYLLNDCKPGENPFRSASWPDCLVNGYFGEHRVLRPDREIRGKFVYKGTLIYNYEEVDISVVPNLMGPEREAEWIGPCISRSDVLILRDPFNLLASKLKWAYGEVDRPSKPGLNDVARARDLWKVYAREYLGDTRLLRDRVSLSYNHWFSDRAYRDRLAAKLGFENRDLGVSEVAKWGPTLTQDSFDGLRFEGRAQEMAVLDRWRIYEDDEFFRSLVADDELHDLSSKIFGELPGTQALR